ncbi:hypothetical protein [Devosia sp. 2618]|uniref:hypothetical protein n=1 Tax=Devosia sp. 2618 TaxID=3156454 RepID=UPI00339A731D
MNNQSFAAANISGAIIEAAIDQMKRADLPLHVVVNQLATYAAFMAVKAYAAVCLARKIRVENAAADKLAVERGFRSAD